MVYGVPKGAPSSLRGAASGYALSMSLKNMADRARRQAERAVEQRGGKDALRRDADQVKDALKAPGSLKDKARRAADAVKKPG